ncbi:hypothetical protein [Nocardia sp. NBC_00511]|uniref:hypothetical protein n=1 Tax=Nocardia sp. NBC_00511 TaxID=2903591 RepID=UPI0030DEB707
MGFTSNWLLVQGKQPEQVWEALGVAPSGERSDHPEPGLSGAVRPDGGYLVVEDRAEEGVEDTWKLASISLGCTVIGVGEVDGAGGAEVVVWRDGRKEWGIAAPMDEGGPEVDGEVPAGVLRRVERDARYGDDDDDPDYFNAILRLGTDLTGYQCGSAIEKAGALPFEVLDRPEIAEVLIRFPDALAEALAAKGFGPSPALDGWRTWYTADTPVPGVTAAVVIATERERDGDISIKGSVSILSAAVAEVVAGLPEEARETFSTSNKKFGEIDQFRFELDRQSDSPTSYAMWNADTVAQGVEWVTRYLDGAAITEWFAKRSSLPALLDTAREPTTAPWESNPDPTLMRGTIVLCALDGRAQEAATLMRWYLQRDQFHRWDSRAGASAWDAAMRERFPDYAAARDAD